MANRLFIRTDSSTQIGFGHLMRCIALAQAWKKQVGDVTFISACENEGLRNRIIDEGFQLVPIEKPYPNHNDLKKTLFTINNSSSNNPWVVTDGYHFDTDYQQKIKNHGNKLLVIDDIAHLNHYVADIILNQNINAEELDYSCDSKTKLLLGSDYVLLRKEFSVYENLKREIPEVAKKILVTMGGGDPNNVTLKVLKALNRANIEGLAIKAVAGTTNRHLDTLKTEVKDSKLSVELLQNVLNMPELMAWADAAASAGGSTCWELAFMGVPCLVLVLAENQEGIATGLGKAAAALNCGWYSTLSSKDLSHYLKEIIVDRHTRIKYVAKGRQLVDGLGARRVIKLMREY